VASDQGDTALAAARYQEALTLYRAMGARDDIAWSLGSLAWLAYEQGDYTQAITLGEESLALFQELSNRNGTAATLCTLGHMARAQGDSAQATTRFAEGLILFARVLGIKSGAATCLVGLAGASGARGQAQRAARLFGAAEALREQIATPLSFVARLAYDGDVAIVRAQLDDATLATAWAEGRALSLEQAIAEALHDGD
jgi:tetratricopeptide (TPR) repeat protein